MFEKIKKHLLYAGVSKEEYNSVSDIIVRENLNTAIMFSATALLLVLSMLIISIFVSDFHDSRLIYIYGLIGAAVIAAVSLAGKKKKSAALCHLAVYLSVSLFLMYGMAISVQAADRVTVTFMVMLLLLPLIYVDRPARMAATMLFYMIVFIVVIDITKNVDVRIIDMVDTLMFGSISIVSSFIIIKIKVKSYVMAKKLKNMSEKDMLTGLNNRNCYESRLEGYKTEFNRSISCIYIDANGLHDLNNTKGHKAGDEMLCCMAKELKYLFGDINTYRIGGDEFVVFIVDAKENYVCENMAKFISKITEKGYSAAAGYDFQSENVNISALIEEAEKRMFIDKAKYHELHKR